MRLYIKKIIKELCPNAAILWEIYKYDRLVEKELKEVKQLEPKEYPTYLKKYYKSKMGMSLNLENPIRFTEKLQWRKINDRDPVYTKLSDKYNVREWVKRKIGEEYLIPLLGHWHHFNEIDFDSMPDQFVLKTNNGSHANFIIKDKKSFLRVKKTIGLKIERLLHSNILLYGLELHYLEVEPLIIAERYIQPINNALDLIDYKFHCFNGIPIMCEVIEGRSTRETVDYYDMDWNHLSLSNPPHPRKQDSPKPEHFDEMIGLAKILSMGFQYVRVDLYDNGKVYFGEMTFTPSSGLEKYDPDDWDYYMGKLWDINDNQICYELVQA